MSTTYFVSALVDGVQTEETAAGLERAKMAARKAVEDRGLTLTATDWYRDSEGVWRTRKTLAPAIVISLRPGERPRIPAQRRESTWESRG